MWLWRGAQSAVFYYATCTPCAEKGDRRKRMKEAKVARSQRAKEKSDDIVTDQPRPFPQPTAFSTNPGWADEIALGPGPPARRGGNRSAHRRTDSWNTDANSCQNGNATHKKDKGSIMQPIEDRWNRLRNQREDEPLWGEDVEIKGSSVGLAGSGKASGHEPSKYYTAKAPPVNDLHPPIVSGPKSRAETRWMLQPPPSARVMAGKEHFNTSSQTNKHTDIRTTAADKRTSTRSPERTQLPPISTQPVEKKITPTSAPVSDRRALKTPEPRDNKPSSPGYGRGDSNSAVGSSLRSRSDSSTLPSPTDSEFESPRVSIQSPETPVSRPMSKGTDDDNRPYRPHVSKALTSLQRDDKKVELLHLEISDLHDEVGLGQLEHMRPWRWSMDI
ncbi:hypothetical protein BDV25DRAFT_163386 [Aspergillus avenaceus]|uniref:Uncharacterized protein n=1 Tax=Aspergillus avenaceus TaxID=36643 RepID=A0A5N6TI01_ASPAV|nr:hypothetical protein BDV25DRAFT_163386 [Aspergillus avenaceus]